MLRAFSTAATGMTAQQMMVDVIANNLANVNTTGFKRSQINFQDLLYVTMQEPGTEFSQWSGNRQRCPGRLDSKNVHFR
jgi:flagellar basal-body rod protein FlgG